MSPKRLSEEYDYLTFTPPNSPPLLISPVRRDISRPSFEEGMGTFNLSLPRKRSPELQS
ncbi:MAG: hypothetical protein AAGA16_10030 [Cyanobacteria bacterium P01_E01_bin.35]